MLIPIKALTPVAAKEARSAAALAFDPGVDVGNARQDPEFFISVVTWAEIEHGIALTDEALQEDLRRWAAAVREQFAGATLPLDRAVLVRWKNLLAELKARNRTVACEDSLIASPMMPEGMDGAMSGICAPCVSPVAL